MINSRKIEDLHPHVARLCKQFIEECANQHIDVIITSTYRDFASQNALYAQGRTAPGPRVTNARGGKSWHNWRLAFDFCPVVNGKPQWKDLNAFKKCGEIGKKLGLEWAGDWKSFKEYAHLQWTGGLTLADLNAGKKPPSIA